MKNDRPHQKSSLQIEQKKGDECVCVCDAAVASIRKQEAALMLGNGDDFHLGDAVIVAVLSVPLVTLMTNGSFVSIQIYFHSRQRQKKHHSKYIITQYK